jgi:hypothetical protein
LNFLTALCVVGDKPVQTKQELICSKLFSESNMDVLLHLKLLDNKLLLFWFEDKLPKECLLEDLAHRHPELLEYYEVDNLLFEIDSNC